MRSGTPSRLEVIGSLAFYETSIAEMYIPDSVPTIVGCFEQCAARVVFIDASMLQEISFLAFHESGIEEIHFVAFNNP